MKTKSLLFTLQCAALATGAPVLLPHPPEKQIGKSEPLRSRWKFGLPRIAVEKDGLFAPLSNPPTTSKLPSTEHLAALRRHRWTQVGRDRAELVTSNQQRLDMESAITVTGVDISIATTSSRLDTPCHLARLSQERDDVTVVLLSMAFFLIVLAVESWSYIYQSVRRTVYGHGAIRLEDEGDMDACGRSLSVHAFPGHDEITSESEKTNV